MLAGQLPSILAPLLALATVQDIFSHRDRRGIKGWEHTKFLSLDLLLQHTVIAASLLTNKASSHVQICSQLPSPTPKILISYQLSVFTSLNLLF